MEDELELGDGFSGIEEEYELGNERSMSDEVASPEYTGDYDDEDDSLAEPFGIGIEPASGYLNDRFTVTIYGTPNGAKAVKLHTVKGRRDDWLVVNDPVIANVGHRNTVELIGSTFLINRKLDPTIPNTVKVYARAYMKISLSNPTGRDKLTRSVTVNLEPVPHTVPSPTPTPGPTPTPTPTPVPVCKEGTYSADGKAICRRGVWVPLGATKEKLYLTPQEADALVRAGRPCYIKCMIPIISLFPGIPYFTGCPILPGFVIQKTP